MIGKQPGAEVWVFNNDVQVDHNGEIIDIPDRQFILESKKHDFLANIAILIVMNISMKWKDHDILIVKLKKKHFSIV